MWISPDSSRVERENFQVSGAGYGLHWPDLDEDVGVAGLLLGKRSRESPVSFQKWLAKRNPPRMNEQGNG
ncbi:MAG: DUF2442 domain-containing protein [Ardenticatenales bacterium]|nr:DUF2442 domain-containing protein [Ardenticatenales bacterium]